MANNRTVRTHRINLATERPTPPPDVQYRRVRSRLISSLAINDPTLSHACVTSSDAFGYGVFSWHGSEWAAQQNATLTGGRCVQVQRDDRGEVILPDEAAQALQSVLGPLGSP